MELNTRNLLGLLKGIGFFLVVLSLLFVGVVSFGWLVAYHPLICMGILLSIITCAFGYAIATANKWIT